jgi:glutamyl-tRNA reductase
VTRTVVALSASHATVDLDVRERFELSAAATTTLLTELVERPEVQEAAAISTCNRTEVYLVPAHDPGTAEAVAVEALADVCAAPPATLSSALRVLRGSDAARHLLRVTAGLESMVVGEMEVQGQVRRAYELALSLATTGPVLNRLFQDALRAGKRARSETGLSRSAGSVASVAVELARRALGGLAGKRVLVVGAGKHGELTARTLAQYGAGTIFVTSRAHERAASLAGRFGGDALGFDRLREELGRADLLLTCTACPHRILTRADLAAAGPLVVIDTAVPRDVEPAARDLPGIELYDLDDIQAELGRNLSARSEEVVRAEPILEEELDSFRRWLASLEVVPTISALRERGHAAVERALRQNERRFEGLTDGDRERVERVARAVASDLLHEPTLTLRRAGEGGASALYVETVRELFGLSG